MKCRTTKRNTSLPAGHHIINQGLKEMVQLIARRFIGSRDNARKEHILGLVAYVKWEIEAGTGDDTARSGFSSYADTFDIEKVYVQRKH